MIFGINFRKYNIGRTIVGYHVYLRALQGHSGRNLIDPSLQDNVIIQRGFFQHIYHTGCAFNLHSIINNGLILGDQNFKQETNSILLAYWSQRQRASRSCKRLTSLCHVVHNTCTVLGRNIKTRYFGSILILRLKRDWHSVTLDRMQSSFKEYFQLIVFQKLSDWRLEKSFLRNHTCLLDLRQRSLYVTIGPEGKFHWFLRLINSQKVKLFDSLEEKFNTQRSPN